MKALMIGLVFFSAAVEGLEKVGTVAAAEGNVTAVNADQNERALAKDSDIFLDDTVMTGDASKGEIQFSDGTLVLLIPGSTYSIDSFSKSGNHYGAKLYQGGIRVLTGLIAKKNPENFEIATPNATIGVRGTLLEARMMGSHLYVGSSTGGLSVKNSGGKLDLGSGMPSSFAQVPSMDSAPEALASRPPALDLSNFQVPAGGIAFDQTPTGTAAAESSASAYDNFAWGPLLGTVTMIGAVAGIVLTAASKTKPQTAHFAH